MVGRLDNVIYVHNAAVQANRVRLVNIARLVVSQAAALNVIGIVSQVNLYLV